MNTYIKIIGTVIAVIIVGVELSIRLLEVFHPEAIGGTAQAWPSDIAMMVIGASIGAAGFKKLGKGEK